MTPSDISSLSEIYCYSICSNKEEYKELKYKASDCINCKVRDFADYLDGCNIGAVKLER